MGLDANIIRVSVPEEQLPLLREYLQYLKITRQTACNGKPLYRATPEEKETYVESLKTSNVQKFKALTLDCINAEAVKYPAVKNSYGNVGYWRVGYGGSIGIDPKQNFVLGTLYEAFPELHPNWGGYYGANWADAREVVLSRTEELRAIEDNEKTAKLEVFLETIDYVLSQPNPETYFISWFP